MNTQTLNENTFWKKLAQKALKASKELVTDVISLYYVAVDKGTPAKEKAIGIAAVSYFFIPLDAIPDWTPVVGYSDDIAIVLAAVGALTPYITEEIRNKSKAFLDRYFS